MRKKWKRCTPPRTARISSSVLLVLLIACLAQAQDEAGNETGEAPEGEAFEETSRPSLVLPQPELEGRPRDEFSERELEKAREIGAAMPPQGDGAPEDAEAEDDAEGLGVDPATLLRGLASLGFVLALILLAFWGLKRLGRKRGLLMGADLGREIGRVHLSPKATLHYVKTAGKVLVLGVTQNEVRLVTEFDAGAFEQAGAHAPSAGKAKESQEPPFRDHLRESRAHLSQPVGGEGLRETPESNEEDSAHPEDAEPFDAGPPAEEETVEPARREEAHEELGEDDIESLRGDIERLQQYLQDTNRGSHE